jgi:hypothetical protein
VSKRFTATEKWSDPWFRSLSPTAKLLWFWILDNCDHAGIIEPDLDLARFQIGASDDLQRAFEELGSRLELVGKKYFVRKFVAFQYGDQLNPANTAHRGVIRRLESAGLQDVIAGFVPSETIDKNKGPSKDLQSPFKGAQDKDKDKDKDSSKKRSRSEPVPIPDGVDPQVWSDWFVVRRKKKLASPTATALGSIEREARKAGLTLAQAIKVCAEKEWAGFEAAWLTDDRRSGTVPSTLPPLKMASKPRQVTA